MASEKKYGIGVDVGATKVLGALVDRDDGSVVFTSKVASPQNGAADVMKAIEDAIQQVLDGAPADAKEHISGIGLGVAGQVDPKRGVLLMGPNLGGGIKDVVLVEPLRKRFHLPVVLANDVEVAAIGEGRFGAGRGVDLFACVFVGTGIGGALMQNGQRYGGAAGSAGEIGHMMVRSGGRPCSCGQRGHLEAYCSRTAIVNMLREEVEGGAVCSIGPLLLDRDQRVKSRPLSQAVNEKDALVTNVMTQAGIYLGMGLASLINLWSPRRVILGGGVIDRIDLLFDVAIDQAKSGALPAPAHEVDIIRAELGDYSGAVGAAVMEEPSGDSR
jgi:glucokinase